MKKIVKCIIVVFVLILNVAFFSSNLYSSDKKFSNDNELSAINCLMGNYVCCINDAYQQRYFKSNIIKNMDSEVDTLVIASSHFLQLSLDDDNKKFLNLSLGAATFRDKLNILGLLELCKIKYKKVIFEMDIPGFIDVGLNEPYEFAPFHKYGRYLMNLLDGKTTNDDIKIDFNNYYLNNYKDIPMWNLSKVYTSSELEENMIYYKPNAAQVSTMPNNFNEDVLRESLINDAYGLSEVSMNERAKNLMTKLLYYFKYKNIDVHIVVVPRPPYLYDGCKMNEYKIVKQINEYVDIVSKLFGYEVTGSFNPHDMGINEDDYVDAFHLKSDVVNSVYYIN